MDREPWDALRALAELADLRLSEERLALLAGRLHQVRASLLVMGALEYGEIEPAARFSPPEKAPQ